MKILIQKSRNTIEGVNISKWKIQSLIYFTKDFYRYEFNKTYFGWYFIFRFCFVGVNVYYK